MENLDLLKQLKHLYSPSSKNVTVVDVPRMSFFMIDGRGDPNTASSYNGKTWVNLETEGWPSKWGTLRACRVLKMAVA